MSSRSGTYGNESGNSIRPFPREHVKAEYPSCQCERLLNTLFSLTQRRTRLYVLEESCQADRGVQASEDVKMIFHTVDAVKMAMTVLHDAPNVAEKVFAAVALENRCPVLGGKHDVVRNGGVG